MNHASRRLVRLLLGATLCAGIVAVVPATAAPVPNDATWSESYFPSGDGTQLHADVLLPRERRDGQRHPVILSIGPYFGSGSQTAAWSPTSEGPSNRFNDLITDGKIFAKGYALVLVDSRGYGSSGGCSDFGGPGEQRDAKAAVEWAATQSWSTGKVGMWGKSYDAWTQVMALAEKPKGLAATVIQAPIIDGYRVAFENGVPWSAIWYTTTANYAKYDLTPGTVNDDPEELVTQTAGTATNPDCYAENLGTPPNPDPAIAYWTQRNLIKAAGASRVPTFWAHGFNDVNTKPTNIFPVYSALTGPKRAWFGQWNHVRGNEHEDVGRNGFMAEAMNWLDHYLRGKPLRPAPSVEIQDGAGSWRTEQAWPPKDGVHRRLPLRKGTYADDNNNSANSPDGGTWSVTQATPYDVRLAGMIRFDGRVQVTTAAGAPSPTSAPLVALVYDVDSHGKGRLISRGASMVANANEGKVRFELWPQDWLLAKGHRLAVQVSADDTVVYFPNHTNGTVTLLAGELRIPWLAGQRRYNLDGGQAAAAGNNHDVDVAALISGRDVRADFGPRPRR